MGRKRDTVDIIKALVALLTPTISISLQVDNGDGTHTLSISNTYWLRLTKIIDIGGVNYLVESFIINESITISLLSSSDSPPSVSSFLLPAPHFLHGTTEEATVDQQKDMAANNRTPFIYLIEPLVEKDIKDVQNIWGRESRPRLYFMDESLETWNPPTHKTNVIQPVRQMIQLFFDKIADEEDNLYKEILDTDSIAAPNWGKFVTDRGYKGKFFSDTITGLQVDFDFTMSKDACEDIVAATECPLQIVVQAFAESIIGTNDGYIIVSVFNGIGTITFSWTGPSGFTSTDQNIFGLTPGAYTVIVSDSNMQGCEKTSNVTVAVGGAAPDCTFTIDENFIVVGTTVAAGDGTATVVINGGSGDFSYRWEGGQTTVTATGLSLGPIGISVVDNVVGATCHAGSCVTIPNLNLRYLFMNGLSNLVDFTNIMPTADWFFSVELTIGSYASVQAVSSSGNAYILLINSATLVTLFVNNSPRAFDVPTLPTDTFFHLAMTNDDSEDEMRLYIDDVESTTEALAAGQMRCKRIGANLSGNVPLIGGFDNYALASVMPTPAERTSNYEKPSTFTDTFGAATDVHYKCDETSGTNLADESTNNNDGTLAGYAVGAPDFEDR